MRTRGAMAASRRFAQCVLALRDPPIAPRGARLELADHVGELILVEARLDDGLDTAVGENLHRGGRELIGDEDARGHGCLTPLCAMRPCLARTPNRATG